VEAGKKAAADILKLQLSVQKALESSREPMTAGEIAALLKSDPEDVFHVLNHIEANSSRLQRITGGAIDGEKFSWKT
jgi:hypothetical protein